MNQTVFTHVIKVVKPNPTLSLWPIVKDVEHIVIQSQSKLKANTHTVAKVKQGKKCVSKLRLVLVLHVPLFSKSRTAIPKQMWTTSDSQVKIALLNKLL